MKKSVKKIIEKTKKIKVRLDRRTVITVKTKEALNYWLSKYPDAEMLS